MSEFQYYFVDYAQEKLRQRAERRPSSTAAHAKHGTTRHRCSNCGTSSSPAWRKGFHQETLCNACGIQLRRFGRQREVTRLKKGVTSSPEKIGKRRYMQKNLSPPPSLQQQPSNLFPSMSSTPSPQPHLLSHPSSSPSPTHSLLPTATEKRTKIDVITESLDTPADKTSSTVHGGDNTTDTSRLYVNEPELMQILCSLLSKSIANFLR